MQTITLTEARAQRAFTAARAISGEWQAECLELLRIPAIRRRWQQLNSIRLPFPIRIDYHPGKHSVGMTREQNLAVPDWSVYAGYVFSYGWPDRPEYGWNRVRPDWFSHSPSCAWEGVRRETVHRFLEAIRYTLTGYEHESHWETLRMVGIRLVLSRESLANADRRFRASPVIA